jgi:predicted alpha/beta superfamily hydrolase
MGGLAAMYAALARPDVFGGALVMSPSLWVERGRIFEELRRRGVRPGTRIYLDAGRKEPAGMVRAAEQLGRELRTHGMGKNLRVRIDARGRHAESSWRRRFPAAWKWVSS